MLLPWRIAILRQTSGQAPLTAGVVVLDHRARTAGPLEVVADVVGGHAAHYGFDAVAVAVVDEVGYRVVRAAGCNRVLLITCSTSNSLISHPIRRYRIKNAPGLIHII